MNLPDGKLSPVVADIGGRNGRIPVYIAHTGEVFLKRIGKTAWADTLPLKG